MRTEIVVVLLVGLLRLATPFDVEMAQTGQRRRKQQGLFRKCASFMARAMLPNCYSRRTHLTHIGDGV
jgi:hypothetical protein